MAGRFNILPRSLTRIDPASVAESLPRLKIEMLPIALKNRSSIPCDAEPAKIIDCRLHKLFPAAVRVEVLDPESERATGGPLERSPKRCGVSHVEESRGRWGKPAAIGPNSEATCGLIIRQRERKRLRGHCGELSGRMLAPVRLDSKYSKEADIS